MAESPGAAPGADRTAEPPITVVIADDQRMVRSQCREVRATVIKSRVSCLTA